MEVQRFKPTGKYYETIEVPVNILGDYEAHTALAEERERRGDEMIWLMTGRGLTYDVPRIIQ